MDTLLTRKLNCCGYAVPIRRIIRWVWAAVALVLILGSLHSLVLSGWGHRITAYLRRRQRPESTELESWPEGVELKLMV